MAQAALGGVNPEPDGDGPRESQSPDGELTEEEQTEREQTERERSPSEVAAQRRRLDEIFGDTLPEATRDDRVGRDEADPGRDDRLRRDVPPHHGSR